MQRWDRLYLDVHLATMRPGAPEPYGAVKDGALAVDGGRIAWVGARADLPAEPEACAGDVTDCGGRWLLPGLVDCHTHIVFGGSRAAEFEQRLLGRSYEEIARAGGGIASTVRSTRAASGDELKAGAAGRLEALMAEGLTTVEIKSGYGLDRETEMRCLRVARELGRELPLSVRTTYLGLHAVPPEHKDHADEYVDLVCEEVLPAVHSEGLADAVDAFCERIAFSSEQTARFFGAARSLGLPVKLHADQLSDGGGAALATRFSALSADHIEHTGPDAVAAMAQAGTVAVLLPGAFYCLGETKRPPVDELRAAGVPMAVSTDANPGSSPCTSPLLMLNMACTLFGLTPEEALAGVTRNAAAALGLLHDRGTLEPGKRADLALFEIGEPAELAYWIGGRPCAGRVVAGAAHGVNVP